MKLHIKEARERIGMSQKDFAAILEIGASTLNGYEKGNHEPKSDILCKIAKLCNTTIDYLLGITNDPEPETPNFKTTSSEQAHIKKYRALDEHGKDMVDTVLNKEHERILSYEAEETPEEYFVKYYDMPASAGTGVPLDDEPYQYLKVPETPTTLRADFAIRVSGDSMEPKYYDGDILLVENAIDIEIGEIGIFVLNGAGYVKKKGRKGLISLNENYNDIDVKEYDNCKCVGKVIGKL